MGRLSHQFYAKGGAHLVDRLKTWLCIWSERFVQSLASYPCAPCYIGHATGLGNVAQGGSKKSRVIFLNYYSEIGRNIFFILQQLCRIKIGKIGDFCFFAHGLTLQHVVTLSGCRNISLLGLLVTTAKHHNQAFTPLGIVHAPAWTKVLPHFKNTITHRPYITEVTKGGFSQVNTQSQPGVSVFQAVKPFIKFRKCFNLVHIKTVIERIQKVKAAAYNIDPLLAEMLTRVGPVDMKQIFAMVACVAGDVK